MDKEQLIQLLTIKEDVERAIEPYKDKVIKILSTLKPLHHELEYIDDTDPDVGIHDLNLDCNDGYIIISWYECYIYPGSSRHYAECSFRLDWRYFYMTEEQIRDEVAVQMELLKKKKE